MIAHTVIPVSDYKKSKAFYDTVLETVGYEPNIVLEDACGYAEGGHASFWISQADETVPLHIAFEAKDKKSVDASYKTALAHGAKDNGGPGYRPEYWPGYYAAFVFDPDGHNIEAVWYDYEKAGEEKP
jgi:catechol 2,3-dioxygenase-like lactoylglutathione lyase family enzyme